MSRRTGLRRPIAATGPRRLPRIGTTRRRHAGPPLHRQPRGLQRARMLSGEMNKRRPCGVSISPYRDARKYAADAPEETARNRGSTERQTQSAANRTPAGGQRALPAKRSAGSRANSCSRSWRRRDCGDGRCCDRPSRKRDARREPSCDSRRDRVRSMLKSHRNSSVDRNRACSPKQTPEAALLPSTARGGRFRKSRAWRNRSMRAARVHGATHGDHVTALPGRPMQSRVLSPSPARFDRTIAARLPACRAGSPAFTRFLYARPHL